MSSPTPSSRAPLRLDGQRALIPASLVLLVVLRFVFQAPIWVLAVFSLWIPAVYIALPWQVQRQWRAFEREFAMRFPRRDYQGLLGFYQSQWLLRRFGPRQEMLQKLGLVYAAMGRQPEAEHVYELALANAQAMTPVGREQLLINLAATKIALDKPEDARQLLRSVRQGSPFAQSTRAELALLDLPQGRHENASRQALAEALRQAPRDLRERIEATLAAHPAPPGSGASGAVPLANAGQAHEPAGQEGEKKPEEPPDKG